MKKILFLFICLFFITGCNDKDTYKIKINDPYEVCGQEVYFSDDADGNEVRMSKIIDTIQEACNYNN